LGERGLELLPSQPGYREVGIRRGDLDLKKELALKQRVAAAEFELVETERRGRWTGRGPVFDPARPSPSLPNWNDPPPYGAGIAPDQLGVVGPSTP
jgi:hypothetical protein